MAVNYKELDDALGMMGAPKDTRPMPKTKPIPLVKPKPIKTSKKKLKPKSVTKAAKGGMMKKGYKMGGMMKKGYKAGGKMPDLTGDNKVTQADVLKGRGAFKAGGMMKKGYKKGGKVRGAGKATKGVRAAKMVTMKGS